MSQKITPPVLWAQRKDQIYITIDVQDIKNEKISIENDKLFFSGNSGGKQYEVELKFFKEIDSSKSKYVVRPRSVEFVLQKKESGPYWDKLLQDKGKFSWLKVDWNKWKDEDETDETGFDMGNFDMNSFGGGMENFNEEESDDDEDIPGTEEKKDENKMEEEKKEEKMEEGKKEEKMEEEKK